MDQFDRGFRQRVMEHIATAETSGYGPVARRRGIAGGVAVVVVLLLSLVVVDSEAISLTSFVVLGFIVGACVVLIGLWRRGPDKRRDFFIGGIAVVVAGLALAYTIGEWEARRVTRAPWELARDTGVALTYPGAADIRAANPAIDADLYPGSGTTSPWQPLVRAVGAAGDCVVVDATDYADARRYWGLNEAAKAELAGLEAGDTNQLMAQLSQPLSGLTTDRPDVKYLKRDGRIASFELEYVDGSSRRHFLLVRAGRWIMVSCSTRKSESMPKGRWKSVARSIDVRPSRGVPTPPRGAERALRRVVPFVDCRTREGYAVDASAVITCDAGSGTDITYLRFGSMGQLRQWWKRESAGVPRKKPAKATDRCRRAVVSEATYDDGRFLCREAGVNARISWVDVEDLTAAFATSSSTPLESLFARWERDRFGSAAPPSG